MNALKQLSKIKNCSRNVCFCGNKMRKLILKIPISKQDEIKINSLICETQVEFKRCK